MQAIDQMKPTISRAMATLTTFVVLPRARDLKAAGCKKVFQELEAALATLLRATLVVTKLDRLARSACHLTDAVYVLEA